MPFQALIGFSPTEYKVAWRVVCSENLNAVDGCDVKLQLSGN
jgi:hypothetical protein